MTTPIKNPTMWKPPTGTGTVVFIGNLPILDNTTKLPVVTNITMLPILTNPNASLPKNPTMWTQVG